jgi:hypothetical protein
MLDETQQQKKNWNLLSASYSRRQIKVEFTHEGFTIGKIFDFLPVINGSWAKREIKDPNSPEIRQKEASEPDENNI